MYQTITKNRFSTAVRAVSLLLIITFLFTTIMPPGYAQTIGLSLPIPGTMVNASPAFVPVLLKGMTVHPDNPLQFDFIIDSGHEKLANDELKTESERLVKYFLASMTVPQNDLWVNLSPYEKDRIVPEELGKTELGRDLLAQDYILKQLTATMMYPEEELGKKFWGRVHQLAKDKYGVTDIPTDTFNKVWILPETATVYEHENTVYITDAHLKVLLDSDYQSAQEHMSPGAQETAGVQGNEGTGELAKEIIREVILPEIEKEVNTGKNFATLRQIYHSLILAKWYKQTVKNSIMSQVYIDKNKTAGIELNEQGMKEEIYDRYMQAYQKGVFNYIKEDYDELSQTVIPRQYFSGGFKDPLKVVDVLQDKFKAANAKVGEEHRIVVTATPQTSAQEPQPSSDNDGGDAAMLTGPYTLKGAREKINHENWKVRLKSVQIIAKRGDQKDIPVLLNLLDDSDLTVQKESLVALVRLRIKISGALGGHQYSDALLPFFIRDAKGFIDTGHDFKIIYIPEKWHYEDGEESVSVSDWHPEYGNPDYREKFTNRRVVDVQESLQVASGDKLLDHAMLSSFVPVAMVGALNGAFASIVQSPLLVDSNQASFFSWLAKSGEHVGVLSCAVILFMVFHWIWLRQTISGNIHRIKKGVGGVNSTVAREYAVEKLVKFGNKRAIPRLIEILSNSNAHSREFAYRALEGLNVTDDQLIHGFIAALKSKSNGAREYAAKHLGILADSRATEPLINALSDSNPDVRKAAATALGKIGDTSAVEPLIKESGKSTEAIESLGKLKDTCQVS